MNSLLDSFEVLGRSAELLRIIPKKTDSTIAVVTEDAAHLARHVVMIDVGAPTRLEFAAAGGDRAATVLRTHDRVELFDGEVVELQPIPANAPPLSFRMSHRVGAPMSATSLRICLVVGLRSCRYARCASARETIGRLCVLRERTRSEAPDTDLVTGCRSLRSELGARADLLGAPRLRQRRSAARLALRGATIRSRSVDIERTRPTTRRARLQRINHRSSI